MIWKTKNGANRQSSFTSWIDWFATLTLVLTGLAGAVVLLFWFVEDQEGLVTGLGDSERDVMPLALGEMEFAELIGSGQRLGSRTAPVQLLVYHDYRCGFCLQLHETLETLRSRYPQHLAVVYKHFVDRSGPSGRDYLVPLGVECAADQGMFERYHDAVYENSQSLGDASAVRRIAEAIDMHNVSAFVDCVTSRRYAERISLQHEEAGLLGTSVVPTMFLNGRPIVGALDLSALDSLIASELPRVVPARPGKATR